MKLPTCVVWFVEVSIQNVECESKKNTKPYIVGQI